MKQDFGMRTFTFYQFNKKEFQFFLFISISDQLQRALFCILFRLHKFFFASNGETRRECQIRKTPQPAQVAQFVRARHNLNSLRKKTRENAFSHNFVAMENGIS